MEFGPSEKTNYKIWREGIPIEIIALIECSKEHLGELKLLLHQFEDKSSDKSSLAEEISMFLASAFSALAPDRDYYDHKFEYRMFGSSFGNADGFAPVTRLLSEGHIRTYGFLEPRSPKSPPFQIPPDVWEGDYDLAAGTVWGNDLSFCSARIVSDASYTKHIHDRWGKSDPVVRSVGRPSNQGMIFNAYQSLKSRGVIDFNAPMTKAYISIRKELVRRFPGSADQMEKLANETIRGVISDKFKDDKKARPSSDDQ